MELEYYTGSIRSTRTSLHFDNEQNELRVFGVVKRNGFVLRRQNKTEKVLKVQSGTLRGKIMGIVYLLHKIR